MPTCTCSVQPDDFRCAGISSSGISNNNPGNIRPTSTPYLGQVGVSNNNFIIFDNIAWGVRAWLLNFFSSVNNHGTNTILSYVTRYAPASDGNNPEEYAQNISNATGIDVNAVFGTDQATVSAIMKAQFAFELGASNAAYITDQDVADGYALYNNPASSFTSAAIIYAQNYPYEFYGAASLLLVAGGLLTWAIVRLKNRGKK